MKSHFTHSNRAIFADVSQRG